jgi:hypothetical protein
MFENRVLRRVSTHRKEKQQEAGKNGITRVFTVCALYPLS